MAGYDDYDDFFEGDVILLTKGLLSCMYQLADYGSVIKVHNAYHVRKVRDQFNTPPVFSILAYLSKVTLVTGIIPDSYVKRMTNRDYLRIHSIYL